MGPLIKITTEPLQMVRFTQNARLVNSDSIDMERRKAVARQMTMRRSTPHVQGSVSVKEIAQINQAFSHSNAAQVSDMASPQIISRQAAQAASIPASVRQTASVSTPAPDMVQGDAVVAMPAQTTSGTSQDISVETNTSYTAQRGAFEMRVARGDLTYLPPLVMTVITQRPQVHVEYLGGFNYVPPLDSNPGRNVNLFT